MNWFKAQSLRSAVGCTQSSVNSHEITSRFYFHPYDNRNDRFKIEIGRETDQHSVKFRDSHSFVIPNLSQTNLTMSKNQCTKRS